MTTSFRNSALAVALILSAAACSRPAVANPAPSPSPRASSQEGPQRPGARPAGGGARQEGPKPYGEVITAGAVTQDGLFRVHRVDDKLYFEIPASELNAEMLLIGRAVESTLQEPSAFFGGGPRLIVQWERNGNSVVLREKEYDVIADTTAAIWRQVSGFRKGPVLARYDVAAFGPDSAAVVDVTDLFLSNIPELGPVEGINRGRSWVERTWSFERNVNVEVTQSGQSRPSGNGGPPAGPGAPGRSPQSQTVRMHFSMSKLPDSPMMPRWHDERVGFISSRSYDFSRPDNRLEQVRFIHRFKLEKKDPSAEVSDPVEPIVYWIDPATPDWLKPWIVKGVDAWQDAFAEAGFSNAIFGRIAPTPEEDPDFSLYDARRSVIYWRPSTVPNATGGQIVDPRSGEILKGEVNMYHNIMELQKNWYFIQVGPLDARARSLPLPDSLMGRLVEYVVTHEIGHSIGFPHNMKSSAMYPADSVRSRSFLERMGGSHVATLMDYSRFNYVAQPEDSIPLEYLIPKVGPYDEYAVRWGYKPIPGASTPDQERSTLDAWAREQDESPWLRFSTPDAEGDPEDLTEAVGDADAVQSTTYGMRNLQRVMDMMLEVAEVPGESYEELETLYGQAVGQWGRYMGHVAAIVGGAYTQERYGTGPRFRPLERARQREAVRYLNANAFRVPGMFLDDDILRRIENEGVVERFRVQQNRVIANLLNQQRLERLVEFEAMADSPGEAYTLADLMEDLRAGIWGELDSRSVRVNAYRRNVQRAFLAAADDRLHPSEEDLDRPGTPFRPALTPPWASDVRAVLRVELEDLDGLAERALARAGDAMTRAHLRDVRMEIARILDSGR
ncbi:MAG: zinc-dependent metalloprotease [Gemmatimonadota bacterium]|nr:zinc-dependent metalloprotease [Gemmatimonadota bacterium]